MGKLYKAVTDLISSLGSLIMGVALWLHWMRSAFHAEGLVITLAVGAAFVLLALGLRGLGWIGRKVAR